jgi:hypothetical protein
MAKRGRPNKNGVKPGWMLIRSFIVLHAYCREKAAGEKHSTAIAAAVSAVHSWVPGTPISKTEVKRVLAEFLSKDFEQSWIIIDGIVPRPEVDRWFENLKWVAENFPGMLNSSSLSDDEFKPRRLRTLTIQVGPRPRYPRHNARS